MRNLKTGFVQILSLLVIIAAFSFVIFSVIHNKKILGSTTNNHLTHPGQTINCATPVATTSPSPTPSPVVLSPRIVNAYIKSSSLPRTVWAETSNISPSIVVGLYNNYGTKWGNDIVPYFSPQVSFNEPGIMWIYFPLPIGSVPYGCTTTSACPITMQLYDNSTKLSSNSVPLMIPPLPLPVPTNLNVSLPTGCAAGSYTASLSWTNTGKNWFVDVSTDSQFASSWSYHPVTNDSYMTAPNGFAPSLTLKPTTIYYWRIWNGQTHVLGQSFQMPTCASPAVGQPTIPTSLQITTIPACTTGNFRTTVAWTNGTHQNWVVDFTQDPNFATWSYRKILTNGTTSTYIPPAFVPWQPLIANNVYYWRIWNGQTHVYGGSFVTPAC